MIVNHKRIYRASTAHAISFVNLSYKGYAPAAKDLLFIYLKPSLPLLQKSYFGGPVFGIRRCGTSRGDDAAIYPMKVSKAPVVQSDYREMIFVKH